MKAANKKLNANRDIQNRIGRAVITKGVGAVSVEELERLKLNTPASKGKGRTAPRSKSAKGAQTPEDTKTLFSYASESKSKNALATPGRSTGKRQRPTSTRPGKDKVKVESDHDDDMSDVFSDDNYHDTPSKRRVVGARSSTKARGRSSNPASSRKSAAADSTPSKRRPVRAAAVAAAVTMHNAIHASELSDEDTERRHDLVNQYKKRLCEVLGVGTGFADQFDLRELRTYARAFNAEVANEEWKLPGSPETRCIGPVIYGLKGHPENAAGETESHISLAFSHYQALAIARGDLSQDLTLNPNGSRHFSSEGDPETDEALGVLENDFGIFR
jgi:hypothetical protein